MTDSVRCVVFGRQDDAAVAEVLTFLRGFSALYGSGLALRSNILSSATEVDALAAQELKNISLTQLPNQLNQHEHGQLFARISVETQTQTQTQTQELIVFGKAELMQWMKQQLLESRYNTANTGTVATGQETPPLRLFISGDRAQVGKSTVCLGLVGALLRGGYTAQDLAYIKPATQCENPQLVTKFCRQQGIRCCEVGPILFYKGFTREFLKGETDSSTQLLGKAKTKVEEVGRGKKVVVVDGVGYPAVGSICGLSNAHVAKTLETPVVLVGKKGVGDAVDSFNLNATFFESHGVKVLGGIFNRLPEDGFYSLEHCKENVTAYFEQFQPEKKVYGFLPELTDGGHSALGAEKNKEDGLNEPVPGVFLTDAEDELAKKVVDAFVASVDLTKLLEDAEASQGTKKKAANGATKPKAKKAKKARNFEIPTSFEIMGHPAFDTVPVSTSAVTMTIPTFETMELPAFDTVPIPTSTETMAIPTSFETMEIPTSLETMEIPTTFDTVPI